MLQLILRLYNLCVTILHKSYQRNTFVFVLCNIKEDLTEELGRGSERERVFIHVHMCQAILILSMICHTNDFHNDMHVSLALAMA